MPLTTQLPMEIIIKIAKMLYIKEFFVELEIMIYIIPKLTEFFNYKIPTVILVDEDQYEKFVEFIHSRKRPYGSRDLFIIKQQSSFKSSVSIRLKFSKCHIILGSKCHQKSILKEFKRLSPFVDLFETNILVSMYSYDKSYKCYELNCAITDEETANMYYLKKPMSVRHPLSCSYHVALSLYTFLKPINPRMIRFESYCEKNDLHFEWLELYGLYTSFINMKYNRRDARYYRDQTRIKDRMIDTPKCSFEFIKDIYKLSKLSQCTTLGQYDNWEWTSRSSDSVTKNLERDPEDIPPNTDANKRAFFYGLKNVSVEKIESEELQSQSTGFIWINCSKSTNLPESSAYFFVQDFYSYMPSFVRRKEQADMMNPKADIFMTDDEVKDKAGLSKIMDETFLNYVDVFYRSFKLEVLQSADITAYNNPNPRTYEKSDTNHLSNSCLSLKHLEFRINGLVNSIHKVHCKLDKEVSQHFEFLWEKLFQHVMAAIVKDITKSIEGEGLNKMQPLRLRVFDNSSERINDGVRYEFVKEWFNRKLE